MRCTRQRLWCGSSMDWHHVLESQGFCADVRQVHELLSLVILPCSVFCESDSWWQRVCWLTFTYGWQMKRTQLVCSYNHAMTAWLLWHRSVVMACTWADAPLVEFMKRWNGQNIKTQRVTDRVNSLLHQCHICLQHSVAYVHKRSRAFGKTSKECTGRGKNQSGVIPPLLDATTCNIHTPFPCLPQFEVCTMQTKLQTIAGTKHLNSVELTTHFTLSSSDYWSSWHGNWFPFTLEKVTHSYWVTAKTEHPHTSTATRIAAHNSCIQEHKEFRWRS